MTAIWSSTETILVISTIVSVLVVQAIASRIPLPNFSISYHGLTKKKLVADRDKAKELASEQYLQTRLSELESQQRHLIGNISHELRTPLTLIYGYMQSIMRRSNNLTDIQREALEIATSEMRQTIQLLQELLDLARAESGIVRFKMEPVVLNDLIADVVSMASEPEQQRISIDAEQSSISVKTDSQHLKQVLLKLLDNAANYSNANSPIKIELTKVNDRAFINVCDRGAGISELDQLHIFDPLYRVDLSRDRATGGVGLGLASAKMLVEGMGGSINVQSQIEKGSTFSISFPS